jgi:hypothetical protein
VEGIEERYVEGNLSKKLYEKYTNKYRQEFEGIKKEIDLSRFESLNLDKAIENELNILQNPLQLWLSSDYDDKQRLRYFIYP